MLSEQPDLATPVSADSHKPCPEVMGFAAKGQRLRRLRSTAASLIVGINTNRATPPSMWLHACQSMLPQPPRLVLNPINAAQR